MLTTVAYSAAFQLVENLASPARPVSPRVGFRAGFSFQQMLGLPWVPCPSSAAVQYPRFFACAPIVATIPPKIPEPLLDDR